MKHQHRSSCVVYTGSHLTDSINKINSIVQYNQYKNITVSVCHWNLMNKVLLSMLLCVI
jgi:hypothetical protein